jgi:HEAT repeat protein
MRYRVRYMLLCVAALGLACAAEVGESRDAPPAQEASRGVARTDDAVGALLAAVRVDDPLLCALAVERIDQRGSWSRWGRSADELPGVDSLTAETLRSLDQWELAERDVRRLSAALRDDTSCVRRVAASLLSRVADPAATAAIGAALADARPEVREVAAIAAGMAEATAHAAVLGRLLGDSSAGVRRAAAWALGAMESHAATDRLLDLLARDADARVRQAAAWAVGRIAAS